MLELYYSGLHSLTANGSPSGGSQPRFASINFLLFHFLKNDITDEPWALFGLFCAQYTAGQ